MNLHSLIFTSLSAMGLPLSVFAASGLAFNPPKGWTSTTDPQSQLTVVVAPGNGALATFIPSTPFSGTAKEWHEDRWKQLASSAPPIAPPQNGEEGLFLTRTGVFRNGDGSQPWIRLYTTMREGLGEGLLFIARDEQQFLAHRPAVDEQVRAIAFASVPKTPSPAPAGAATPAKSPPAIAPIDAKSAAEVAGLYLATTRQLRFNPLGGSGSADWEVRTEFYLLSRDGQVFRGRDLPAVPGGDLARFDFAAARREAPGNYGAYEMRGGVVRLQFGGAGGELIEAKRVAADALEIRGTRFTRSVAAAKPAG